IAFNGLLNDGKHFAESLLNALDPNDESAQLIHVATDGETYGHHHTHGDMALAYCLDFIEKNNDVNLTNYSQYLSLVTTEYEAQVHENSSWSCVHGVERWRNDCGCNTGGKQGWNQQWRKPLREALDWLRDKVNEILVTDEKKVLRDMQDARDSYINVV